MAHKYPESSSSAKKRKTNESIDVKTPVPDPIPEAAVAATEKQPSATRQKVPYTVLSAIGYPCCYGRKFDTPANSPHTNCFLASNIDRIGDQKAMYKVRCRGLWRYMCEADKQRTMGMCYLCGECISVSITDQGFRLPFKIKGEVTSLCGQCSSLSGNHPAALDAIKDDVEAQDAWVSKALASAAVIPRDGMIDKLNALKKELSDVINDLVDAKELPCAAAKNTSAEKSIGRLLSAIGSSARKQTPESMGTMIAALAALKKGPKEKESLKDVLFAMAATTLETTANTHSNSIASSCELKLLEF